MFSIPRVKDEFDHFPYMQYIFRIVFTLRINIWAISFHFPIFKKYIYKTISIKLNIHYVELAWNECFGV